MRRLRTARWLLSSWRLMAAFARSGGEDWRVSWALAQDARHRGDLPLVDAACAAVLRHRPDFWFARELPKHARGWYAQSGQDEVIEDFFERHPPRSRIFVDVGAFDGVHYSNVRRLHERHGWTGLCIEPVPENFRKLEASYRNTSVRCLQAAVTPEPGTVEMHVSSYPHLPDWGSDVATLHPDSRTRWAGYDPEWRVERVRGGPLSALLTEARLDEVDLLSIDTEGSDLDVLRTLDLSRSRPRLIVIEYGSAREEIIDFLAREEFDTWHDNGQDLFAADAQAAREALTVGGATRAGDR